MKKDQQRCNSKNHYSAATGARRRPRAACWGELRLCPICKTLVCMEDGAADDLDRRVPGICDTCALDVDVKETV